MPENMELRSRHNMKYWDHTPYLGLGPAAHSFDGRRRWWNCRSVEEYCRKLKNGLNPVADTETLTTYDLQLETLSLGMRTMEGIAFERYNLEYGCDLLLEKKPLIDRLADEGLLALENGILRPTRRGMALADALARDLSM